MHKSAELTEVIQDSKRKQFKELEIDISGGSILL